MLSGNFYGSEKSALDFLGVKFWSRDFLGVLIFAPIRSFPLLEIRSSPPPSPLPPRETTSVMPEY